MQTLFLIYYNQITTTVSEEIVYNLIQNEIIETINTVISDTSYTTPDPVDDPIGDPVDDMPVFPTDDFGPVVTLPTISLDDVAMPIEIQTIDEANEWVGIADYENKPDSIKVMVHFDTEEDRENFMQLLDNPHVNYKMGKTWKIWYPERGNEDPSSIRFEHV